MDADFWPLPWREIVSYEVQNNCWGTFPLHVSVIYNFNHSNINTTTQHIWATLVTKINALTQISRNNRLWKALGTFRTQSDLSMSMAINCWLNIMRKLGHFSFKLMVVWLRKRKISVFHDHFQAQRWNRCVKTYISSKSHHLELYASPSIVPIDWPWQEILPFRHSSHDLTTAQPKKNRSHKQKSWGRRSM